jgi:hypothetical protein
MSKSIQNPNGWGLAGDWGGRERSSEDDATSGYYGDTPHLEVPVIHSLIFKSPREKCFGRDESPQMSSQDRFLCDERTKKVDLGLGSVSSNFSRPRQSWSRRVRYQDDTDTCLSTVLPSLAENIGRYLVDTESIPKTRLDETAILNDTSANKHLRPRFIIIKLQVLKHELGYEIHLIT